jgi:heavy metal sensor kinase
MAQRAEAINAEHLSQRLTIVNPDDELGHLGLAFNETLSRLERSFEQLKRFTADASHELRTPLTAMRSVGEVALQESGSTHSYREAIGSMLEETNRLTRLVDTLLMLSRADAAYTPLHRAEVCLLDLAKESASLLEVLAEEKQITLTAQGDPTLRVLADPLILRQAFLALLDNAVKFSPQHGNVSIWVGSADSDALVEVRDSGPGVPPEHRDRIFERFYRVDKARSPERGGTGLGLSIAQWAVAAHGGKIELESKPDSGCTFRVRLPRDVVDSPDKRAGSSPAQ